MGTPGLGTSVATMPPDCRPPLRPPLKKTSQLGKRNMKNTAKVFLLLLLIVACGIAVLVMLRPPAPPPSPVIPPGSPPSSAPPGPAGPPGPSGFPPGVFLVSEEAPWTPDKKYVLQEFFGYMSTADTAPPHANGAGLDILGRYCECDPGNVIKDAAFKGSEDLQKFLLTFRAGHPYYTSSRNDGLDSFGKLRGGSWAAHVKSCATKLDSSTLQAEDSVLLIETDAATNRRPIVCISGDLRLRGLVVRRGGILLIDDDVPVTTLRVNFILVETGGVLQAGASKDGYRYENRLSIILTHPPDGYGTMPVVASQCPYHVYAPGVQWIHESETCPKGECPKFSGFDGTSMCFTNAFAAKTVAVGFNGTFALCGQATQPVSYNGTWRALEQDGSTTRTNGRTSLSIGSQKLLDPSYRLCWARLNPGSGVQNSTSIELHPEDTDELSLEDVARVFTAGSQILITGSTEEYSNGTYPSGMLPIYISAKDGDDVNSSQNNKALADAAKSFLDPNRGVEVAIVSNITQKGKVFALNLRTALKFDHSLQTVQLNRSDAQITVETTHHVALLSHNITIDGQDLQQTRQLHGGTGCNNYSDDPAAPEAMGLGISNQTHAQLMGMTVVGGAAKVSSCSLTKTPGGSGGAVTFNYAKSAAKDQNITGQCYSNFDRACKEKLSGAGGPPSGDDISGSWLFGTAEASACNSIFGGTCMFRYGSSALLDSVELVRMGIAPNFGSLGQYAIHFHLFGFAKSFKGYLPPSSPEDGYYRDAVVRNCSIWRSYSRFVTLHGACEVDVCNNVCAFAFGSGFFVEDGTEVLNVFQHNLACCVLPCVPNTYFNPQGIMPNVSTDICQLSLFWLKNNLNAVARNVGCCCPGNTTFVWYVPQLVGQLRGPSAVCMGSERYQLPACGSMASINGPNGLTSASQVVNNNKGNLVQFKTGLKCKPDSCACWVPEDFNFPFLDPTTGCISYTSDNTSTPVFLHAENVGYCLPVFHSEFPEGINDGPQTLGNNQGCGLDKGAQGCTWYFQDTKAQPQFMPANGQNACTDSYVGDYPKHQWLLENFHPQPLTADQRTQANNACAQWTLDGLQANMMPKIFSGVLTFNLGASSSLWGGAGWVKAVPPILIDCCFLETSTRISKKAARPNMGVGNGNTSWGWAAPQTSSFFASSTSTDGTNDFPNLYTVLHNFITNSAVSISSNVTVISGKKTFFDTQLATLAVGGEYSNGSKATLAIAVFDNDIATLFGKDIWRTSIFEVQNQLQLFEYTSLKYYICPSPGDNPILKGSFQLPVGNSWPAAPFKYPYLCGPTGLLTTGDASFSNFQWLNGIVANAVTAQFQTGPAKSAGDDICQNLKNTWQNLPVVDKTGQQSTTLNIPNATIWKLAPACAVPAKFLT